MSAEKEKIFTVLREYHANKFPSVLASKDISDLREEYLRVEDKVVSMVLSVVYGKVEFKDTSKEINILRERVAKLSSKDPKLEKDKNIFYDKIEQLLNIVEMAKTYNFKAKKH